jgi:hypothetical protein
MAYQLSDVVSKVQQRIRDTGYSSGEITNYINDTQNDVFNEYRLPFMEANQNYTMTSGVSDITDGNGLPANYVQAIDLMLTTTGREKRLIWRDIRDIDTMHPDPDDTSINPANVPNEWYYFVDTIKTFPVPNEDYTLTLRYYKKPTILVNDGDVPEVPSQFEELLVSGAAYRVLQVKDNYDQAAIHKNKYDEILQKIVVRYSQPQVGVPTIMRSNRRGLGKAHF